MPRSELLGYDDILNLLDYLGHHVYEEDGSVSDEARAVAHEMKGKMIRCVDTPSWLAVKYAEIEKHRKENK